MMFHGLICIEFVWATLSLYSLQLSVLGDGWALCPRSLQCHLQVMLSSKASPLRASKEGVNFYKKHVLNRFPCFHSDHPASVLTLVRFFGPPSSQKWSGWQSRSPRIQPTRRRSLLTYWLWEVTGRWTFFGRTECAQKGPLHVLWTALPSLKGIQRRGTETQTRWAGCPCLSALRSRTHPHQSSLWSPCQDKSFNRSKAMENSSKPPIPLAPPAQAVLDSASAGTSSLTIELVQCVPSDLWNLEKSA